MIQIVILIMIAGLVALYVFLKKKWGHDENKLPSVSEDVNLPTR